MSEVMDYKDIKIIVPRFNEESGFYTTPERSKIMGKIRGKNTQPELVFRKALWGIGYRYRLNSKKLIGKPDIVLQKYKTVIFIDGEFWHGHNWHERKLRIKSNRDFWIPKIERNLQRDREVTSILENLGYTVFRFWANDVKKELERCLSEVVGHIEQTKI